MTTRQTGILATLLTWEKIGKTYGRRRLFECLSGELSPDQGLIVTGPNGAGKSTLLKVLAGLVRPDSGRVERTCPQSEIGYAAPDQLFYPELTALENLRFACDLRAHQSGHQQRLSLLTQVGIGKSANKAVGTFSTGMIQRLRIATALATGVSLLIFDEPTIGLDTDGRELVETLIRENANGREVVVSTNEPAQAQTFSALGWEAVHVGD